MEEFDENTDWKSELNIIIQKKGIFTKDYVEYIVTIDNLTPGLFQCCLTIPQCNIEVWGGLRPTKKSAEQFAAMILLTNKELFQKVVEWIPFKLDFGGSSVDTRSSGSVKDVVQLAALDYKSKLGVIIQKKKGFVIPSEIIIYTTRTLFDSTYQCSISLPSIIPDQYFVGLACSTKKQAEQTAAQVLCENDDAMQKIENWIAVDDVLLNTVSAATPAINYKGMLIERFQSKGVSYTDHAHLVLSSYLVGNNPQYQYEISIPALGLNRGYTGEVCTTKKAAEQSAIMEFMCDQVAMDRFMRWNPVHKK